MKKILVIALAVMMVFALVACSSNNDAATDEAATEDAATEDAAAEEDATTEDDATEDDAAADDTAAEPAAEGDEVFAEVYDTDMSVLKGLKVGFAERNTNGAWLIAQAENMKEVAEKYGVELIMTDADDDQNKQLSDVEDLCAQGIDVSPRPLLSAAAVLLLRCKARLEHDRQALLPVFVHLSRCAEVQKLYAAALVHHQV